MIKILVTGGSGFLGHVVINNLLKFHHSIFTIGISDSDNSYCDLTTSIPNLNMDFDWVIHIAGKAHVVPKNKKEIADFYHINYGGTKNLLKGLEQSNKLPKSIIFISTVAVYGLKSGENINENTPLNGSSPYALSKIKAEEYLKEWCSKNNIRLGILRPSLIAGKNPPGNLGAMIIRYKNWKIF